MNVYQISGNEIRYEAAKSTSDTKASKGENDFRNILKNKSDKVNTDKGKTTRGKKSQDEKIKDNDLLTSDENISENKTSESTEEAKNVTVINLFSSDCLLAAQPMTDVQSDKMQSANAIVSFVDSGSNNSAQNLVIAQNKTGSDTGFSAMSSLETETALGQDAQLNKTEADGKNNQNLLNTAEIKKEGDTVGAEYKLAPANEKGNEKLSEKQNLPDESDLTAGSKDKAVNMLDSFAFEAKTDLVHVKVAEPYTEKSWKTAAGEIGEAVVESIKDNKIEKLHISLNPKELGEIKVEFVMDHDKISVSLICSNEKTKSLLLENTETLSKLIQSNLSQDTDVNVVYSEKSNHQENGSENYDGRGNNSHYKEDSQHNSRQDKDSDHDFLQKLRLGILDFERIEV